jgi:hypothetical protein
MNAQLTQAIRVTFAVVRAKPFLIIYAPHLPANQNLMVLS